MQLHSYQQRAVDFLHGRPSAGLFLDLGLGKTAISLSALTRGHLPALVVAPKRVAEHVWPIEHAKWRPDLSFALAAGDPAARKRALASRADVTVIGRDNIKGVEPRYTTVIIDESSGFKDRSTTRWKLARKIVAEAEHVWELTGTPVSNGLLDLWAQIYLLDHGKRLGSTLTGYRNRYFFPAGQLPSGVIIDWKPRPGAEEAIHRKLEDLCMYMSAADELELPPVVPNVIDVPLPPEAMAQYKKFKEDLVLDLEIFGDDIFSAANAAVLSNKLSQITAGFVYSDDQDGSCTELHKAKLDALAEVVEGTGDNILVFYRYKVEAERIKRTFKQARFIDEKGTIAAWCRGEVPMMLAHPASAGHGLNLQSGGHTIVWSSLTWDLEHWLQANGRLARQGQTHPVIIHTLECPGTVDKLMAERLEGKDATQVRLLEHLK